MPIDLGRLMDDGATTIAELRDQVERVVTLQADVAEASEQLKAKKRLLEAAEREVAKTLAQMPPDQLPYRSHGRTWRPEILLHVNVTQEQADAVLKAAAKLGVNAISVNTSRIKGWLLDEAERRRELGEAVGDRVADGTPFQGLISEYSETVLRSRKS